MAYFHSKGEKILYWLLTGGIATGFLVPLTIQFFLLHNNTNWIISLIGWIACIVPTTLVIFMKRFTEQQDIGDVK